MTFTCQKLTPDHATPWQALRLEGTRDFPLGFLLSHDAATAASVEDCRKQLRDRSYWGVFADDDLVGYCGYHPQTMPRLTHRAEIGPFFVTPTRQGSGAASALMQAVIAQAQSDGIAQLELYVDTENPRAIAFYEKQGFIRVARLTDTVRIEGQSRDDYLYTLRL